MERKIIRNGYCDDRYKIRYEIEVFDGTKGDTKVILETFEEDITLCWISGQEIENFDRDFTDLINKYRI